jgi:hypothetical protein
MRGRLKYEVSPSSANLHEFIPPTFVGQILPLNKGTISLEKIRSAEIKYAEKRIVVEIVYRHIGSSDVPGPSLLCKSINIMGERKRACLKCWDPRLDADWARLRMVGEQMMADKQSGMILVGIST